MDLDLKSFHPLEVKLLTGLKPDEEFDINSLVLRFDLKPGQGNQAVSWLTAKGLLEETSRQTKVFYELTERGLFCAEHGSPADRLLACIDEHGPLVLPAIAEKTNLENKDVGSAFGKLSKEGFVRMDGNKRVARKKAGTPQSVSIVRSLLEGAVKKGAIDDSSLSSEEKETISGISKKRGAGDSMFRLVEREEVFYRLSPSGQKSGAALREAGMTGDEVGALTPEMLADGSWREVNFRSYNIASPPQRVLLGRKNPYVEFLSTVKDKLSSLGFEELDGPLVETEFWNGDALFMPQFHAARDIHDVYYIEKPQYAGEIEQPWLDNVAAAHENGGGTGSTGWGYRFDGDFARRLLLRSQGTVLSAKRLVGANVPGKYFALVRCFRYDQVDATHGADFYQTDGIITGEEVNLRTLLGVLKMFAEEVAGAKEVKYVPGYFPFTEPSIEVHVKHPVLGWFELGGSGIFRPEVTKPLGIDVPVLAWGIGIDRMALMQLGINDMRELFTPDIEHVRLRRREV